MSTAGWRVPINVKLLAILAVPVLGYLVIASTAVLHAQQTADQIRDQADLVTTAVGPISLTTSLIDERTITELEIAGLQDDLTLRVQNSAEARRTTDEQLGALQTLIADNPGARDAYAGAVDAVVDGLPALRADVDAGGDEATLSARYDQLITSLMDANAAAVEEIDDADLWQGAMLSELATRQKHARALLISALIPVSVNGQGITNAQETVQISTALSSYEHREGAIEELATGAYARPLSALVDAISAADLAALARNTLNTGELEPTDLFDRASYKGGFVYDAPSGDFIHDSFRAGVVEILDAEAAARVDAAERSVRIHVIAGGIGLVLTTAIVFLVSRSIIRPLRSLQMQAIDTATYRLPGTVQGILETPLGEDVDWPEMEPIGVRSRDEVADVADAFNTMQQSALNLAVEEALLRRLITDSLVTLGQRNQDLLSRQLDFITDLERDETDPDILADLFHLDHLAIRMRRNAESLLVLAGIDPPRMWLGPTPIGDVLRAALGEAEEYKRVRIEDVEPVIVVGTATAELSHLVAELIENALRFSPRGSPVEVSGRQRAYDDGVDSGAYTIMVKDSGTGMSTEELELANRRLAGVEEYTMAPSSYMGHYVSGKLAARHGIIVELHSNFPAKGITAIVDLPANLLTTELQPEAPIELPPVPRAERQRHQEPETEPVKVPERPEWKVPVTETAPPDLRLLDMSGPVPTEPPPVELGPPAPAASGSGAGSSRSHKRPKPKKRRMRPLAASKLPVPPPPSEPLVIQPAEQPGDSGPGGPADPADEAV